MTPLGIVSITIRIQELVLLIRKRHLKYEAIACWNTTLTNSDTSFHFNFGITNSSAIRSEGATMPTARSEITATNIGDDIYVIGGFDGSGDVLDVVEVYNIKNNSWKSAALYRNHCIILLLPIMREKYTL